MGVQVSTGPEASVRQVPRSVRGAAAALHPSAGAEEEGGRHAVVGREDCPQHPAVGATLAFVTSQEGCG